MMYIMRTYFFGFRPVQHSVEPGYLERAIPSEVPESGEPWKNVLADIDNVIMPGITHWHHPNFHGYFAAANSFPAIVGEMMSAGITSIGVNWVSNKKFSNHDTSLPQEKKNHSNSPSLQMASPAYTELEVAMMNWLGKLLNLPDVFLNCSEGPGGGVLQGSASESTFLCLLTAKEKKVNEIMSLHPEMSPAEIRGKLVAYSSDQSNSSVEKSSLLGSIPMRLLPADSNGVLRASTLKEAVEKDKAAGLIPCYLVACLGTTPTCAFDDLTEIGPICENYNIWLHIDAAYAGAAFACPEYRYLMAGIEFADSFNFNPHKWMLVNYDCSALWLKDASCLVESFNVDRIYLKVNKLPLIPEYRHWQIPLGRRFRALKLWFVLRIYGVQGIQQYIRKHIELAQYFEKLVEMDDRFEVVSSIMGLVCIRFGDDEQTVKLLDKVIEIGNLYVIGGQLDGKKNIRFSVCSRFCEKRDIEAAWIDFQRAADILKPKKKEIDTDELKTKFETSILNEIIKPMVF